MFKKSSRKRRLFRKEALVVYKKPLVGLVVSRKSNHEYNNSVAVFDMFNLSQSFNPIEFNVGQTAMKMEALGKDGSFLYAERKKQTRYEYYLIRNQKELDSFCEKGSIETKTKRFVSPNLLLRKE